MPDGVNISLGERTPRDIALDLLKLYLENGDDDVTVGIGFDDLLHLYRSCFDAVNNPRG